MLGSWASTCNVSLAFAAMRNALICVAVGCTDVFWRGSCGDFFDSAAFAAFDTGFIAEANIVEKMLYSFPVEIGFILLYMSWTEACMRIDVHDVTLCIFSCKRRNFLSLDHHSTTKNSCLLILFRGSICVKLVAWHFVIAAWTKEKCHECENQRVNKNRSQNDKCVEHC